MKKKTYHKDFEKKNTDKLRELIKDLPSYAETFFIGIETTTSVRTRVAYAFDLRIFFQYFNRDDAFEDIDFYMAGPEALDLISPEQIEGFLSHLSSYHSENIDGDFSNHNQGKSRKLATLRSFYKYYFIKKAIQTNPASMVSMPKNHDKSIVRLEINEIAKLLDVVESGAHLTEREKKFHTLIKERDLALLTLLLGTGIRVSECVGLDISDVDFETNGINITRKGGNESIIYFGDEVSVALRAYLEIRERFAPKEGHEEALFLSLHHRRLSIRSVQSQVKKYSSQVTTVKRISPHKLRSTYGTSLYRETGDIYLVADVLGHKDVNTTKRHYSAIEDSARRNAAKAVKLRD